MGVWSCATTAHDDPRDWTAALLRDGWTAVRTALASVVSGTRGARHAVALAAAAVVAAAKRGSPDSDMPKDVRSWLAAPKSPIPLDLVDLARRAAHACMDAGVPDINDEDSECPERMRELLADLGEPSDDPRADEEP